MKKVTSFIIPPLRQKQPKPFWNTSFQAFCQNGHFDTREKSVDAVTALESYDIIKPEWSPNPSNNALVRVKRLLSLPPLLVSQENTQIGAIPGKLNA